MDAGVCGNVSTVLVLCRPPKPRAGLTSTDVLSGGSPAVFPDFSVIACVDIPPIPVVSFDGNSYHRDNDDKLINNSIGFVRLSRVLSTNKYRGDFSSCSFYKKYWKNDLLVKNSSGNR